MLGTQHNSGFSMTFEYGLTISVQFGISNYCSRRCFNTPIDSDRKSLRVSSPNAEIAIMGEGDDWLVINGDTVAGWVSTDEVADWIHKVKTAKCLEELGEVRDMSLDSILGKD